MKTHELAATLERLRDLFGEGLNKPTRDSLTEAASAFRELPDQNLRALLTLVRRAAVPQPAAGGATAAPGGVAEMIAKLQAIRTGEAPASELSDPNLLNKTQLGEVLRAFGKPFSGNKPDLVTRVRLLCVRADSPAPTPNPVPPAADSATVADAVRLYEGLLADRRLSISDVRAGFAPLRDCPKPAVEEISRKLGYTPAGSREEILDRLLNNLEGIKMSQHRADRIMTGTGT